MKIAIQGHPTRGKEIIQILESLGGENRYDQSGKNERFVYYINNIGFIYSVTLQLCSNERRIYTLEEFEKEFPFKVGDKVIHKEFNDLFEVIAFNPELTYPYKIKGVCEFNTKSHVLTKWQPKMKEERFVTLTLDKAKEWYNKGGELKEIALQAFTENELNSFPKSWEEFAANHARRGYYISSDGKPLMCASSGKLSSPHVCPSKESAEAHLAMIQLEQLRNCWWNGWEPKWNNSEKFIIKWDEYNLTVLTARCIHAFLVFPTRKMAEGFLKCFRDLIEKAGNLI